MAIINNIDTLLEAKSAGYSGSNPNLGSAYLDRSQGFSPENPYYQQMAYATKKSDLIELQQQAIRWEAEQQAYQQQMSDQERLRDEQREYESPAAQLARQRQAGINPDLAGSAGGSAAGSSSAPISAPDLADAQAPDFVTPQEEAATIFDGINTAVSALSGITGTLNAGVDFARSLATFGDSVDMTHSVARSAEAAANVDEAIAGDNIQASQLATLRSRLSYIGESASLFRGDESDDEILETFKNLGDLNPEASAGAYKRYRDNPAQQAAYQKALLSEKQARAENESASFEFLLGMSEDLWSAKKYSASVSSRFAQFQNRISEVYHTIENAQKEAGVKSKTLSLTDASLAFAKKQLEADVEAWQLALKTQAEQVAKIDEELAKFKDNPPYTHNDKLYYRRLLLHKANLEQLGSQRMHEMYDVLSQYFEEQVYYEGQGQTSSRTTQFLNRIQYNHRDFYFRRFVEDSSSLPSASTIVGAIIGGLLTRSAKGAEVGASLGSVASPEWTTLSTGGY